MPARDGRGHPPPGSRQQAELARQQAELRRRERRLLALVAAALVVVLVAAGIGFQAWRTGRAPSVAGGGAGAGFASVTIRSGQPIVLGKPGARVQIALYEDFHCPHCADFAEEYGPTLADLQARGVASVAVYPMAFIDEGSAAAANAMACAAVAGFGQAYYDGLFANPALRWTDRQLEDLARRVNGSVPGDFATCVRDRPYAGWVDSVNAAAAANGVTSTPTLFLRGSRIDLATLTPVNLKAQVEAAAG